MIIASIIFGIIVLIAINTIASVYIGKAPGYELSQKAAQIILIWLIPFIGAALFSSFLWFDRKEGVRVRRGDTTSDKTPINEVIDRDLGSEHDGGR